MKPVCIVTGASGRLGQDLCMMLVKQYRLVAIYHSTLPSFPATISTFNGTDHCTNEDGANIYLIQADLTNRVTIQRLIDNILERYGQIDTIINAAADLKFHGHLRNLWTAENHDYPLNQLNINSITPILLASAVFHCCWKNQPDSNDQWNRSVVNVSSISGLYVFKQRGQAFYGVSKAALNMLTLYLSLELAPYNVRVNAVCPSQFSDATATRSVTEVIQTLISGGSTGLIVDHFP